MQKKKLKKKILGVTCHNSIKLAEKAKKNKVDYLAFGSFFKSKLKPKAKKANIRIIKNANKLEGIPGSIVQGRYDLLCPVINAFEIAKYWKNSNLIIVDEGAHSANSDPMREKLIRAIKDLTNKLI